ncbi:antibiotic biosynthesis monooxygenase [Acidisoma cellulosilytica]|uniref:Antibiotic biosynthesis monooxygenase n=1 Tax=Acidisoma cellulosilyticum TaxID=2802395 RepID=A0A963Z406_9PROT|nr:putative quinol monooxygenase [Acidisoma cellulosilyticum]MCB8881517.1 antibiotic biosynthesis monooxygenase [Acidisoma cellulosilyticum]
MTQPIDIVAVLTIKAGHEAEIFESAVRCTAASRKEEGCLLYKPYRSQETSPQLIFVERWKDKAAIAFHESTEHFKAFIASMDGKLTKAPEILLLDELG